MQEFLQQTTQEFQIFLLILIRVSCLIVVAPIFGNQDLPVQLKGGLTLIITWVLWSVHGGAVASLPTGAEQWLWAIITEAVFGLALAFVVNFIFTGAQLGGVIMGWQIGFGFINILDPLTGEEISLLGQFQYILASLIFIIVGGPLFLLEALGDSLWIISPGALHFNPEIGHQVVLLFGEIFIIGVKVSAPVMVTLLMLGVIEGLIARTVPQMNILLVGFPIRIGTGLMVLAWSVTAIAALYVSLFGGVPHLLRSVMKYMN